MAKKNEPKYLWRDRKRTFLGLPWSFTIYYLTETKLIRRKGVFNLEEDEIDLYKITDKKLLMPMGQRMVGCGTIHICSRDTDSPEADILCIKNPHEVMDLLDFNMLAVVNNHTFNEQGVMFESTQSRHRPDFFTFHDTAVRGY